MNKYSVVCVFVRVASAFTDIYVCCTMSTSKQFESFLALAFILKNVTCSLWRQSHPCFAILPDGLSFVTGLVLGHYLHSVL